MEKDHQIRYADLERQLEEETRTLRFQYQDLEFHSNTKQSQQKELLGMLHEEFLQYRNEAVERRQALLQELENQQQKAQVMASYRVVQDVALTADISDAEDEVKGDGMERLRRIGTISTQTSFKNGVIEDEDDGEVRDQQKKKHKKHRSKNSKRKRAHKHRIKKRANSNEFNIHEDNDSSDSEISSSDSGSDSDSALDEDVINEMRIQRAKEQLRRNATFFDKQYKPVEASHFNNPEAWNYFAERLHEERNKFKELLHYLAGEKKKIANEMKKFGMVMEEMKKEMPNLILKQMEGLQDQHMLQLIMQEIQRRVSTVSFPSSFTNTITSTSSFSSTDTASGEAPQNMVPAIIAPSVNRKSSVTAMTELDTKELLQLGRRLSRMMSSSSVVTRKSIRFEDTDRELFPHFEREDSLESESDSHAIDATLSLSRESPTRSSIEIEYIGSERQVS